MEREEEKELKNSINRELESKSILSEEAAIKYFREAARIASKQILQQLVQLKGKQLFLSVNSSPVHFASKACSIECLEYLLSLGFDKHADMSYYSEILLQVAVAQPNCSVEYIEYLISIGIDPHAETDYSENIFLLAIREQQVLETL